MPAFGQMNPIFYAVTDCAGFIFQATMVAKTGGSDEDISVAHLHI